MSLKMDVSDMIPNDAESGRKNEEEEDENGIMMHGSVTVARVQRVLEELEKQEQEKRKRNREKNRESQLQNRSKLDEVNEQLDVVARDADTVAPPLRISNVLLEPKRFIDALDLHAAAKENDIGTINACIKSGYDLNAEDNSQCTPLLIAIMNQNFDVARALNQAHIDVLVKKFFGANASSRSWYNLDKEMVQIAFTNLLTQKMIAKKIEAAQIGKTLAELHCNLNEVVKFNDLIMTKAYLQSCPDEMRIWISYPENNMLDFDVQHIRIVINTGPLARKRKREFVMTFLSKVCEYQKTSEGREFLKNLASWEFVDEDFLEFLEKYLQELPKKFVKIILQHDFRKIAETKFGWDISRICFGNFHPKVIRLLKKEDIDVDRRYYGNNTPLHIACKYSVAKNIQMLLRKNADPNAINDELDTPMTLALKSEVARFWSPVKSVKYLLFADADIMGIADRYKDTFFGFNGHVSRYRYATKVIKLLIAQLAIYELVGLSVEEPIKNFMNLGNEELEKYYKDCRIQLEQLKMQDIQNTNRNESVDYKTKFTIFNILAKKPEKFARYINEEQLQILLKQMTTYDRKFLHMYYRELLRERIKNIIELSQCRKEALNVICQLIEIEDPNHLIVDKIVSYFTPKDLRVYKGKMSKDERPMLRYNSPPESTT